MSSVLMGEVGSKEVEVSAKARRRFFTVEYKRRILKDADRCTKPGEIGELLRREGLYSSSLGKWRRQRDRGEIAGLTPKRRGPVATELNPLAKRVAELEREVAKLRARAERAEALVELQKKVAELFEEKSEESGGRE